MFTQQHPELRVVGGASSYRFVVLVVDNGSAWFAGELGRDMCRSLKNSQNKFIPLEKPREDVHIVSVDAGVDHILLLTQNGKVLSVGSNPHGQLGLGQNSGDEYSILQLISFFEENNIKIQSVCCGEHHNLALSYDGKVYGWGDNGFGQCGVSNGANREKVRTPELIDIELDVAVKRIECGTSHSGLLTVDNEVYLWGSNEYNECCANTGYVFTPQNVTDYVLSESKKDRIIDFYLGRDTTQFLLK